MAGLLSHRCASKGKNWILTTFITHIARVVQIKRQGGENRKRLFSLIDDGKPYSGTSGTNDPHTDTGRRCEQPHGSRQSLDGLSRQAPGNLVV